MATSAQETAARWCALSLLGHLHRLLGGAIETQNTLVMARGRVTDWDHCVNQRKRNGAVEKLSVGIQSHQPSENVSPAKSSLWETNAFKEQDKMGMGKS